MNNVTRALLLIDRDAPTCNCGDAREERCKTVGCSAARMYATEELAHALLSGNQHRDTNDDDTN